MFGVSFSELVIVCIVAFFIMQPKDIRQLAHWYKYILKQIMELRAIAQESMREINKYLGINDSTGGKIRQSYVIDEHNKPQKACDSNPLGEKFKGKKKPTG
jgi:Sec-independent protein translocase protein TatA